MTPLRFHPVGALLALVLLAAPTSASAYPLLFTKGERLREARSRIVLARAEERTVLTVDVRARGSRGRMAVVVPAPSSVDAADIHGVPREVLDRLDVLSGPRFVEEWEQDPCAGEVPLDPGGLGPEEGKSRSPSAPFSHGGSGSVRVTTDLSSSPPVRVLEGADALVGWLSEHGYSVPPPTAERLAPYADLAFVVIEHEGEPDGAGSSESTVQSPPVRIAYRADELRLPLGAARAGGSMVSEVRLYVVAFERHRSKERHDVTVPTDLGMRSGAAGRTDALYADLVKSTFAKHSAAFVTEYAWPAMACRPCPTTPLSNAELVMVGADTLLDVDLSVDLGTGRVRARGAGYHRQVARRIVRRHWSQASQCLERAGVADDAQTGSVAVQVVVDEDGVVSDRLDVEASPRNESLARCLRDAIQSWPFPPTKEGTALVELDLEVRLGVSAKLRGFRGNPLTDTVLTRLRFRPARDAALEDLVLEPAPHLEGGLARLHSDGYLLRDAGDRLDMDSHSRFQPRYVVFHPWTGDVKCDAPIRGRWAPEPPAGWQRPSSTSSTHELAAVLRQPVPELGIDSADITRARRAATARRVQSEESSAQPPGEMTDEEDRGSEGGCGHCTVGGGSSPTGMAVLGLLLLRWRRGGSGAQP